MHEHDGRLESIDIGFPIIVVDAPLTRCVLGESGEIELEEIAEGEFLFVGHKLGTCIRVVTASRLISFAAEARQVANQLRAELKTEEEAVLESWRKK